MPEQLPAKEPRFKVGVFEVLRPDALTLVLRLERPKDFLFRPGQYAWIVLPNRSKKPGLVDRRAFSISSGVEASTLEFVIRATKSDYNLALFKLKVSDVVDVIGPFGSVFVPPAQGAVMISGGVGVSPFLSIFRSTVSGKLSLYAFYAKERPLHCLKEVTGWGGKKAGGDSVVSWEFQQKSIYVM